MASRFRRQAVMFAALAAVVVAAACAPVAPPPPPPPPPPPTTTTLPNATTCAAPLQSQDGKTQYFAVVDDGAGPTEAVTFDAATEGEKTTDVAQIEATEGDVVAVEPDYPVELQVDPSDEGSQYSEQWAIGAAGFVGAWANVPDPAGAGVKIAELDTGVFAGHQDLAGAVLPGTDQVGTTDGRSDPNGHGTHVAGILGMRDNTVGGLGGAPSVQIFPVRVLNAQGEGSYSAIINGITDAMNNGANVISMSLGGSQDSASLQAKVTAAVNAGIVVVAAAGNNGSCSTVYPGRMTGVIAVASTDSPGSALSLFSSRGPDVDIAAPGGVIISTLNNNGYGDKSGTSMATPYVAAAAALLKAKCPGISPLSVETKLESTASPMIADTQSGALRADTATVGAC